VSSDDNPARRVVVGVDSSLSSRVALEHAVRRVGTTGSLLVAHVVNPLTNAISSAMKELDDERHAVALELVERLADDLAVESDPIVLDGFASAAVRRRALPATGS
jgi:nucleotide-binding universal stress UspA family protein